MTPAPCDACSFGELCERHWPPPRDITWQATRALDIELDERLRKAAKGSFRR